MRPVVHGALGKKLTEVESYSHDTKKVRREAGLRKGFRPSNGKINDVEAILRSTRDL